jgi:hypothetical protein
VAERVTPLAAGRQAPAANPLLQLVGLGRRARLARDLDELAFLAVNETHGLAPYRQAALWFTQRGVKALSGVVEPETNAPYVQWLQRLCRELRRTHPCAAALTAADLPADLAQEWADWWPAHALWLPFAQASFDADAGALLLAADQPWNEDTITLLKEWLDTWHHAWQARKPRRSGAWRSLRRVLAGADDAPWWKRRFMLAAVALAAAMAVPVRLSVLAPGELVPAHPAVIRAPVDGVLGQFQVQPNQRVNAGDPLFSFDEAPIAAHREMAAQALATAQVEYRQYAQQALSDPRSKAQLATLLGKIEERRADAAFFQSQFDRARVTAPQAGTVLFDDPSDWIGKPVQTGERIMRIASPGDVEVEAWLPIGDAIPLRENAPVTLYLAADPLTPVTARVRYVAHDAQLRPDGHYAYRVRARLDDPTRERVGLKGTAKLSGERVALAYWVMRRPLALARQTLGL